MATSTLQLFSCIEVDPASPDSPFHGRYLIHDMTQKCFEAGGLHIRCAADSLAAPASVTATSVGVVVIHCFPFNMH